MTHTSREGKRAIVSSWGKGAEQGSTRGVQRVWRRGAQLEPRGKVRLLGGSGLAGGPWHWDPGVEMSQRKVIHSRPCLRKIRRT